MITVLHQQSGQCPVTQTRTDDPSSYTAVSHGTDSPVRCDPSSAGVICHDGMRLSKCSICIMGQVFISRCCPQYDMPQVMRYLNGMSLTTVTQQHLSFVLCNEASLSVIARPRVFRYCLLFIE